MLGEKIRKIFAKVPEQSLSTEETIVKGRVAQLNREFDGRLTTRVRVKHGVQAWGERGVVFPAEMEKGS
jgi:hypothetical protein